MKRLMPSVVIRKRKRRRYAKKKRGPLLLPLVRLSARKKRRAFVKKSVQPPRPLRWSAKKMKRPLRVFFRKKKRRRYAKKKRGPLLLPLVRLSARKKRRAFVKKSVRPPRPLSCSAKRMKRPLSSVVFRKRKRRRYAKKKRRPPLLPLMRLSARKKRRALVKECVRLTRPLSWSANKMKSVLPSRRSDVGLRMRPKKASAKRNMSHVECANWTEFVFVQKKCRSG
mmetsp:Transcript_6806/g.15522  ORF Transcript_6806/g.15522 Transcript_6806/m.15522 type:complete len:225 (-) Transcript_6806:1293-1967(-)